MIKHNIPIGEYLKMPGMSKSALDKVNKSPAHYQHYIQTPKVDTDSFRLGRAAHASILEPDVYQRCFAVAPQVDRRTKDGKAKWAEFQEQAQGCDVITAEMGETVKAMTDAVYSHPAAKAVLSSSGIFESSVFWDDPWTGVQCKGRPDWWREDNVLVDLKTTVDASPGAFSKAVYNYRYHVQAAFYLDGCEFVTGERPRGFIIIAVEKTPPYMVGVYALDQQAITVGVKAYMENLQTYIQCRDADEWPGYSQQIEELTLPAWAINF